MRNTSSPVTFGLISLRTALRQQAHDKARRTAVLLRAHENEAKRELADWTTATSDVTPLKR